jgi:hypothetical protein
LGNRDDEDAKAGSVEERLIAGVVDVEFEARKGGL